MKKPAMKIITIVYDPATCAGGEYLDLWNYLYNHLTSEKITATLTERSISQSDFDAHNKNKGRP